MIQLNHNKRTPFRIEIEKIKFFIKIDQALRG